MKKYILNKKLKKLSSVIDLLLLDNNDSVAMIHNLRKKTRELLSLVATTDPFYPKLKKVIKLSNKIRDIDVFLYTFMESLKSIHKKSLDTNRIILISKNSRNKLFNQLYLYLKKLEIPADIKYKHTVFNMEDTTLLENKPILLKQKALHKYRIKIKQIIYSLKNNKEKEKISILTTLKDLLGKINDNYNGLKRLQKLNIEDKLFKDIEKYIMKRNNKNFNKVQELNRLL